MNTKTFKCELELGTPKISEHIQGGNSSVYKGHLPNGMTLAIKKYKGDKTRVERMLTREIESIQFLRNFGIQNIPEIVEIQRELGLITYLWIEGIEPLPDSQSMDELINFCISLKEVYSQGNSFDNSIDAIFSAIELESQISNRIQELEDTFSSAEVNILCSNLREKLCKYVETNKNVVFTNKTFSVSDLGTHNMINSNHKFYFIDFEFFGLDSVNKMVGDFILHPKNNFDQNNTRRFIENISNKFEWDSTELMKILPLLTLKWALIAFARTFKEENSKDIVKIHNGSINKSIGTQYLKYFDLAGHIGTKNSFQSFCSFQGIMDQL
jgi:tRNA A-37 threonylcarbamoyl transferase component Bud32